MRAPTITSLLPRWTALVWLGLVAATVLSWWLGTAFGVSEHRLISVAVLAVGFLKARYIGLDFMELRHAPLALRLAMEAWIVLVFGWLVWLLLTV